MMFLDRGIRQAMGVLALMWVVPAAAQENLYANKTPAQIFATDCAICHKQPGALAKAGGPLGLGIESFLRSHYTASRESAALMAKYIQSFDAPAAAPERKRGSTAARPRRPADAKAGEKKPGESKTEEKKAEPASASKPEAKPEAKPAEAAKPAESKPAEAKPAEAKPAEAKPEKSE
jgi:mono/diheme cytochrome c family protein